MKLAGRFTKLRWRAAVQNAFKALSDGRRCAGKRGATSCCAWAPMRFPRPVDNQALFVYQTTSD
jgi:hypothetical protein